MPSAWRPYWRKKRKKDKRQVQFSFLNRPTRAIPRARIADLPELCEVLECGKKREAADHICPVRLAAQTKDTDPHDSKNLMAVCVSHNNTKKKAERMLAAGNRLGFNEYLRSRGWPMERVAEALSLYGW